VLGLGVDSRLRSGLLGGPGGLFITRFYTSGSNFVALGLSKPPVTDVSWVVTLVEAGVGLAFFASSSDPSGSGLWGQDWNSTNGTYYSTIFRVSRGDLKWSPLKGRVLLRPGTRLRLGANVVEFEVIAAWRGSDDRT
jgi:hypothetical protein